MYLKHLKIGTKKRDTKLIFLEMLHLINKRGTYFLVDLVIITGKNKNTFFPHII